MPDTKNSLLPAATSTASLELYASQSGVSRKVPVALLMPDGTTAQRGDVQLAADNEVSAAKAVKADDPRLSNARPPSAHGHSIAEVTGLQPALDAKMTNPMTTAGDLIVGGASGVATRLPIGSEGQALKVVGGALAWAPDQQGGGGGGSWGAITGTLADQTDLQAALNGKASILQTIISDASTARTLSAGDSGALILANHTTAQLVITVPTNASVPLPVGFTVTVMQMQGFQVLFSTSASPGIRTPNTGVAVKTALRYSNVTLVKIATDEWVALGDLATS